MCPRLIKSNKPSWVITKPFLSNNWNNWNCYIIFGCRLAKTKQYEKILSLDGVELTFTEDALEEIADEALQRKTGARGLRAIIEKVMKRVMFEVPSMPEVTKCIVNRESVLSTGEPILKNEADQDIQLKS